MLIFSSSSFFFNAVRTTSQSSPKTILTTRVLLCRGEYVQDKKRKTSMRVGVYIRKWVYIQDRLFIFLVLLLSTSRQSSQRGP